MKKFFKTVGLIILALVGFSFFSVATNPVANMEKKMFMAGELYYTKNVTMAEVDKLGNFFVKEKMFDNTRKSMMLDKEDGVYVIKFVIKKGSICPPNSNIAKWAGWFVVKKTFELNFVSSNHKYFKESKYSFREFWYTSLRYELVEIKYSKDSCLFVSIISASLVTEWEGTWNNSNVDIKFI